MKNNAGKYVHLHNTMARYLCHKRVNFDSEVLISTRHIF